jgi:hypothetical protein
MFLTGCSSFNTLNTKKDFDIFVNADTFTQAEDWIMRPRAGNLNPADAKNYGYFTVTIKPNENTVPNSTYNVDVIYKETNTICYSFRVTFGRIPTNLDDLSFIEESNLTMECYIFMKKSSQPVQDFIKDSALPVKDRRNITPINMFNFVTTTSSNQTSKPTTSSSASGSATSATPTITSTTQTGTPHYTITSPKEGDIWYAGDTVIITWTTQNIPASTTITLKITDGGRGFEEIIGTTKNTGSFTWKVTSTAVGNERIPSLFIPTGGYGGNVIRITILTR